MNRKILTLLAALLLCSCGEGVLNQLDEQRAQDAKSRLHITLTDNSDGKPIASAKLNLQSAGKTAETAASGMAVFEDINAGVHLLLITAEGYASAIVEPYVEEVRVPGDGRTTQGNYRLYPKSATLEGYIQHTDSKGQTKGVDNLPVRIFFNPYCNSGNSGLILAETVTEEVLTVNGKFKFENLPAIGDNCNYSIETIGATIGDQTYGARTLFNSNSDSRLEKESKVNIGTVDIANGVSLFTLANYNREIEYGAEETPVVFTFSENIAANQTGKISVTPAAGYNVSIEGNAITLTPVSRWAADFTVGFSNLKSESGKTYNSNSQVKVLLKDISGEKAGDLKLLPGTIIDYQDNTASIMFKKVEGATGYNYYLEENGKVSKLAVVATCNAPASTSTSLITCSVSIALDEQNAVNTARIGDNKNKIKVQAYNAQYESEIAELEIKEDKPVAPLLPWGNRICEPSIENGKILYPYSCNYYYQDANSVQYYLFSSSIDKIIKALASANASEEYSGNIYFNRAMDKSKPVFAAADCAANSGPSICSRLEIKYEWLNEQVLSVKVKVKAGTPLAGSATVDTDITLKNLTGKNGILFSDGTVPAPSANLTVKISGTIPSQCEINPFASGATCTDSDKYAFCNDEDTYTATPECKTKYPNACDLPNLEKSANFCHNTLFFEDFEGSTRFGVYNTNDKWDNQWNIGYATSYTGSRSAYITTEDNWGNYEYNNTKSIDTYMYTLEPINFPREASYDISFYWKGVGENSYDYMLMCLVPEAEFNYGQVNRCNSGGANSRTSQLNGQSDWVQNSINVYTSGRHYLVFYWVNDGSIGSNPPAAIDDIRVKQN
jgi:hypothetical protein